MVTYDECEREHAMSLHWLAHLFPKEAIRIDAASIAHEGWVWKRSRHLGLWRKRWMVLTIDRHLVTFEDDRQRSGATEHFAVKSVAAETFATSEDTCVRPVEVEVTYPSRRTALLRNLGMHADFEDNMRSCSCAFDAGMRGNREWCQALHSILSQRFPFQKSNTFSFQLPDSPRSSVRSELLVP